MALDRLRNDKIKVFLDSSFLIMPFESGIHLDKALEEVLYFNHEIAVPQAVIGELKAIAERGKPKDKRKAALALKLAERFKSEPSKSRNSDEELFALSGKGSVICTNDSALRRRIVKKGGNVIYLKQREKLALRGVLEE